MVNARRLLVVAGLLLSPVVRAQTPELDQARATFAEALADEQAGRNDVALEKFERVAAVRDTASIEYRIASCLEALGRRGQAIAAYDRAVHLGRGDPKAKDVVDAANARMVALAADLGKLSVVVRGSDAPDVRVDGRPTAVSELGAIMLEPGTHVVDVTAPHTAPARASVDIQRGRALLLTVDLVREAPRPPPPPPPPPPRPSHLRRDVGIALLGSGAAFGVATAVMLVVRNDAIDSIHALCPNDVCPYSAHDVVESDRALASSLELPAAVLGGVAIAALVGGLVLVVLGPSRRVAASFAPSDRGGAFFLRGTF